MHHRIISVVGALVIITLLLHASGCTYANKPLVSDGTRLEDRPHNHTQAYVGADVPHPQAASDAEMRGVRGSRPTTSIVRDRNDEGYFVGLALSGGGSRSANFSAACMFELEKFGLLQKVDYISSVSGGSLTAAYYCLFDKDWNPGNVERKMTHSFASDVVIDTFMPWNAIALMFSDWDRSDLLAESFTTHLFNRSGKPLTYADLRPDRPHLLINATDLQSGRPFIFCNETFDELNSDLGKYPIAYAVAASAAVPVVMHQVTLRDFSTAFKQYRHLIDGGINDNLGIRSLLETYDAQTHAAKKAGQPVPYPHGAIFIVLDARTRFDAQLSSKGDIGLVESLAAGAGLTSTALLNRASSATLSDIIVKYSPDNVTAKQLREQIRQLEDTGYLELRDQDDRPVRVVHIALSRLADVKNLPFQSFTEKVNNIATYFDIDQTEAYHLTEAADLLITEKFAEQLNAIARDLDRARATSAPATQSARHSERGKEFWVGKSRATLAARDSSLRSE